MPLSRRNNQISGLIEILHVQWVLQTRNYLKALEKCKLYHWISLVFHCYLNRNITEWNLKSMLHCREDPSTSKHHIYRCDLLWFCGSPIKADLPTAEAMHHFWSLRMASGWARTRVDPFFAVGIERSEPWTQTKHCRFRRCCVSLLESHYAILRSYSRTTSHNRTETCELTFAYIYIKTGVVLNLGNCPLRDSVLPWRQRGLAASSKWTQIDMEWYRHAYD